MAIAASAAVPRMMVRSVGGQVRIKLKAIPGFSQCTRSSAPGMTERGPPAVERMAQRLLERSHPLVKRAMNTAVARGFSMTFELSIGIVREGVERESEIPLARSFC